MGDQLEVEAAVPVSTLGTGVFNEDEDACLTASQIYLAESSEIFTVTDNYLGRIYTEDGNQVGSATTPLAIALRIDTIGSGFLETTFQVTILPSCHYTTVTPTKNIDGPLAISIESRYAFAFSDTAYRHTFDQFWTTQGFADACAVDLVLTGSAASFTSIQEAEVAVEPLATTQVGIHTLGMTATIGSSEYDTDWSDPVREIFNIDVIIQRNAEIEEWAMRTIMALLWAILVLVITTVYLFCDKRRAAKNAKRKYNPQAIAQPIDEKDMKHYKLIIFD